MGSLVKHFNRSLLFCCNTCCGIVFLCQASASLSLRPDGLACCSDPQLRYVFLLMSWLGKRGWTIAAKCQKCQDPSLVNSDACPTKQPIMNACTSQMYDYFLSLLFALYLIHFTVSHFLLVMSMQRSLHDAQLQSIVLISMVQLLNM